MPPAGTYTLIGGGPAGLSTGEMVFFGPIQGAGITASDTSPNAATAFNIVGNLAPIAGTTTFAAIIGVSSANGFGAGVFNEQGVNIFATDQITFNSMVSLDSSGSFVQYNQNDFGLDSSDNGFVFNNGTDKILIPFSFTVPSVGDVLTVTASSGGIHTVDFVAPSTSGIANGTLPFQFWRWDDNAGTQDWNQVFIFTQPSSNDANVLIGEDAGGLTETSYAGYSNTIIGTNAAYSLSSVTVSEISRNVVIGTSASPIVQKMENSIVLGYQTFIGGTDQIIQSIIMTPDTTGSSAGTPITNSIAIGYGAKVHGTNNTVIGQNAASNINAASEDSVIIGSSASTSSATFYRDTILGANAGSGYSGGGRNVFIGFGTSCGATVAQSIALGNQAQITANHQMVIGGIAGSTPDGAIYDVKFNNGVTDLGGEKYTFKYPDILGSVSNSPSNQVEFYAGLGTGTGAGSSFSIFTSRSVGSGTTAHQPFKGLRLDGTISVLGDASNLLNRNKVYIDDENEAFQFIISDSLNAYDAVSKRYLQIDYTNQIVAIGDVDGADNGTYVKADDANRNIKLQADLEVQIGDALIRANNLHNNAIAQGSATEQDVRSGTYTPTITGVTNITSTTARKGQWMRVGNVVTVSLAVTIDPAGNGLTTIGISLPVASNFGTVYECSGTGHAPLANGHGGPVSADSTNDRAQYDYIEGSGGTTDTHYLTFTYEVL